jgi:hypothetical protein
LDLLYDRDFLFFGVKGTTYYVISLAFIQVRLRGSWIARGVKSLIFQWRNESQLAVDPEITSRCWRSWSRTVYYTQTQRAGLSLVLIGHMLLRAFDAGGRHSTEWRTQHLKNPSGQTHLTFGAPLCKGPPTHTHLSFFESANGFRKEERGGGGGQRLLRDHFHEPIIDRHLNNSELTFV